MDSQTTFQTYINTHVFVRNMTPLNAIRQYLLDNNIPANYKIINAVRDTIHIIEGHCNTQFNVLTTELNNNNMNNDNYHAQLANLENNINIITELHNIINNTMLAINNNHNNNNIPQNNDNHDGWY
jgi:hypothetical protein